ncbi:MAG: CAP domain-containing protein [Patescibacteria group bacterium]
MRRHLLPHPIHGFRATLLSYPALFAYIVFIFTLTLSFNKVKTYYPSILGYATDINLYDLLEDTNFERTNANLVPLRLNSDLNRAAYDKALDMFSKGYWAHISPQGTTPWTFILDSGYDYQYAGENLARDFNRSDSVIKAWMNSSSHKDNILNNNYQDIGFAVANGQLDGEETTLVVQMFGAKRGALATASPEISEITPLAVSSEVYGLQNISPAVSIKPYLDASSISRAVALFLGSFILGLFVVDVVYTKKYHIHRLSGNTIAHILLLAFALAGIWYSGFGAVL